MSATDNGLVWEDPPAPRRSGPKSKWPERLAPLLDRPAWARVCVVGSLNSASTTAARLHRQGFRRGEWEFVSRIRPDGSAAIYARYLGNGNGGPASEARRIRKAEASR